MPSPQAPANTTDAATPVKRDATPSALNAVTAARACVPGRSRSALLRERTHAVSAPVVVALPTSAAQPHRPTVSRLAERPDASPARLWMKRNPSKGAAVASPEVEDEEADDVASRGEGRASAVSPEACVGMRASLCADRARPSPTPSSSATEATTRRERAETRCSDESDRSARVPRAAPSP